MTSAGSPTPNSPVDAESRDAIDPDSRYLKQMRFDPIGAAGQRRIDAARVVVVGVGALGSLITEQLVRAGVGTVRLVDRDLVERSNLQRQVLYTEADIGRPKAAVAGERLQAINSDILIEALIADFTPANAEQLAGGCDLLIDGTDNLETRYLLNDLAVGSSRPWIYGGCVGSFGQSALVVPGRTPCLRCLFPDPPPADALPTCDTAGVLGPAVHLIASLESTAALKWIVQGHPDDAAAALTVADPWTGTFRRVTLADRQADCPTCQRRELDWLEGRRGSVAVVLCGRNTVQIAAPPGGFDLAAVADRLAADGTVQTLPFLTRWRPRDRDGWTVTLFADGRTLIEGTEDITAARSLHAKYIGA